MRERFCKICRGWHDTDKPWPDNCRQADWSQRSELAGPMVIGDTMDPVQSQLDGKLYDSKSQLRATYKRAGVVEVGNDSSITAPKPTPRKRVNRRDVSKSVEQALSKAGFGA